MTESLQTKYRPDKLADVIGQDAVVRSLEKAIEKKLGKAFLFMGPSGTGKTTLARIVAKLLGCTSDILEVDAATKTGIEDMRDVIDGLMYRPMMGETKAIIVDEVHALSKAAITALLKTLEDPPSWVYWFLCTTDAKKIPVAIKTRCLTYQLKEVGTDDLLDILSTTEEASDVDEDILKLCAKEADGSPRQALANLGVCMTAANRAEAAELLRSAGDAPEAFALARLLMGNPPWAEVAKLLVKLKESNPESVRHVIRAYMTKVVTEPKDKAGLHKGFAILEEFSQPFNSFDGMSPLVLACGRLVLGGE